jgi:hypothetical protein
LKHFLGKKEKKLQIYLFTDLRIDLTAKGEKA